MRFSLRTRILSAFALTVVLFLGALAYSSLELRALGDRIRLVNEGYLPLARTAAQVEGHQGRIDLDATRMRAEATRPLPGIRSNASFHAQAIGTAVEQGRNRARAAQALARDPEEQEALATVLEHLDRLGALAVAYEQASQAWVARASTDPEGDGAAIQAEMLRRQKEMQAVVKQLNATLDTRIRRANERVGRIQARATTVGGGLAALALVSGIVLLGLTLLTLRPIGRLTAGVQRVAAGDYSGRIEVETRDEIGVLAREFNAMAGSLEERDRSLFERADELRRLSGYLRSVLDAIQLGIAVVESGVVTMANPAAARLWGVREMERLPAPLEPLSAGRHAALPLGDRRFDMEVVPFGASGRLVVGEDVTRALEDRERLERSERLALIGQMLAQVTHEVRNPLNAISLNADLLGEEMASLDPEGRSEAREILAIISQEIRRLAEVTEHYLDLARNPVSPTHAEDLGDLVRSVCRLEEPFLSRSGVSLEVQVPEGPTEAAVDGNRLRRALLNLLRNAVESGAHRVQVSLSSSRDGIEIAVRDDGKGMDEKTRGRAFDPFFSTRPDGTGLGLAITRRIIEDHGGRVTLETTRGSGCRVALVLPAARA
ncbi:MAG: HAMP domain-containing protein [Deltaproteobacteria bacterium]|nr:HAMP domain-containing protein [Deltaproteobacteria bacterium]